LRCLLRLTIVATCHLHLSGAPSVLLFDRV
jgi:hypothetical protein